MKNLFDYLTNRVQQLKNLKEKIGTKHFDLPAGKLRITSRKGIDQYYHRGDTSDKYGKYIPKSNKTFAIELAQKDYDLEVIDAIDKEINVIESFIDNYPSVKAEDVFLKMNARRKKIVNPAIEPIDVFLYNWENEEYSGLPFDEKDKEIYTDRGDRVRSKSELIIANMLYKEKIPYKYEHPLYLAGFGEVHPDFTILDLESRKEIIWEHFGLMEQDIYSIGAVKKVISYESNGYQLGKELIVTMETMDKPLDNRLVKSKIKYLKELDLCA